MNENKRRITSVDVAKVAGVSQSTVSFVLNNDPHQTISEETRAKVLEAARKLNYQPYAPARLLRTGESKVVLIVWPEAVVEVGLSQILEELTETVAKLGFCLIWQIGYSIEHDQLAANLVPAVVVWLGDKNNQAAITSLQRFKAPIIIINGQGWFTRGPRLQIEYLLNKGPRPIMFAATSKPQLQSMCESRLDIVRQTCVEYCQPEPQVIIISQVRELARKTLSDLLAVKPPPLAICAFNDDIAFATLAALYDLQIPVPEEISVIGLDNTKIAELSNPPLTTIGNDTTEFLEQLIASVNSVCRGGPVLEVIIPEAKVIVRASA